MTKPVVLKPDTLLLEEDVELADFGLNHEVVVLEGDHGVQEHARLVRNVIPFEVCFDTATSLWASVRVASDHLRLTSALLESSVLAVDVDANPIADAQLEFVTTIPLPLYLSEAVRVSGALGFGCIQLLSSHSAIVVAFFFVFSMSQNFVFHIAEFRTFLARRLRDIVIKSQRRCLCNQYLVPICCWCSSSMRRLVAWCRLLRGLLCWSSLSLQL